MITRTTCRVCDGALEPVLDLGDLYVSDFISPGDSDGTKAPLELVICRRCRLLQLKHTVPAETMYRNYWYRSGTNQTMRNALADIANKAETLIRLQGGRHRRRHRLQRRDAPGLVPDGRDPEDRLRPGGEPRRVLPRKIADKLVVGFFEAGSLPGRPGARRVPPEDRHEHRDVLRPRGPEPVRLRHQGA